MVLGLEASVVVAAPGVRSREAAGTARGQVLQMKAGTVRTVLVDEEPRLPTVVVAWGPQEVHHSPSAEVALATPAGELDAQPEVAAAAEHLDQGRAAELDIHHQAVQGAGTGLAALLAVAEHAAAAEVAAAAAAVSGDQLLNPSWRCCPECLPCHSHR